MRTWPIWCIEFFCYLKSNYYQDYSYSLRTSKQVSEYGETVSELIHPAGSKMFGEFKSSINLSGYTIVLS